MQTRREREAPGVSAGGPTHGWLPGLRETHCGGGGGKNTLDAEKITCEACQEPMPVRVAAEQVLNILAFRPNPDTLREALLHVVDREACPDRLERIGRLIVPVGRARRKAELMREQGEMQA